VFAIGKMDQHEGIAIDRLRIEWKESRSSVLPQSNNAP
jgi:hypothetical protein